MSTQPSLPKESRAASAASEVSELELGVIELFVHGVKVLGLPKSVGELFGMLYLSPEPMALDTLVERLKMSKGSASQGLKFLRNLGAVKLEYVAGDRRDHYVAQTELKALVAGFVKGEIEPHLDNGKQRMSWLRDQAEADDSELGDFYRSRLAKLDMWRARGGEILELLEGVLS